MKLEDVAYSVSQFGGWKHRETGEEKMCDVCEKHKATWAHRTIASKKLAFLCFGCHEDGANQHYHK